MPDLRVIDNPPRDGGTRERLLRAAMALLETDGYAVASVPAIAERAGVTVDAFHEHFASKADIFVEIFRVVGEQERLAVQQATVTCGDAAEGIDAVVVTFAGRALTRPRLAWALVHETVDDVVDAQRLAYRRDYTQRLVEFVRSGVERGELPDQDPDLTAAALIGAIMQALFGQVGNADPDAVLDSLTALCRRAVGASPR